MIHSERCEFGFKVEAKGSKQGIYDELVHATTSLLYRLCDDEKRVLLGFIVMCVTFGLQVLKEVLHIARHRDKMLIRDKKESSEGRTVQ